VSCWSSAQQGKFIGQRPTFYHCATQPKVAAQCEKLATVVSWTKFTTLAPIDMYLTVTIAVWDENYTYYHCPKHNATNN